MIRSRYEPVGLGVVFTPDECQEIIQIGESLGLEEGQAYFPYTDEPQRVHHGIRKALSTMIPENEQTQWIFDRVKAAVAKANEQFQFEISDTIPPELMFVKYPVGGKFGMHLDNLGAVSARKISTSIQLSEASEYTGGELVIVGGPLDTAIQSKDIGTGASFPAFSMHKVRRVDSGTRYCLVAWSFGDRHFR